MKVDETFYNDSYEITKIVIKELSDYTDIKICEFRKRKKVMRMIKSNIKS